jgi:hypothetical protein
MKNLLFLIGILFISQITFAQKNTYAELGGGAGSAAGSFGASIHKNWTLGKKDRLIIGTGARFTYFFGTNSNFITAPANLTSDTKNIDTLLAPKPSLSSINALINIGFKVSSKLEVGFNIDAIGFSFGPKGKPSYIKNGKSVLTEASPTNLNILLVGDNDKGSLNSHFYTKYAFYEKFGVKLAYQFLFNELTTNTKIQTLPSANDRFRLKSSMLYAGLVYSF